MATMREAIWLGVNPLKCHIEYKKFERYKISELQPAQKMQELKIVKRSKKC